MSTAPCLNSVPPEPADLLRNFDFDTLESTLNELYADGLDDSEVQEVFTAFMLTDDAGQPRWMTMVDGFYRRALETTDATEWNDLIFEAQNILAQRNAVM